VLEVYENADVENLKARGDNTMEYVEFGKTGRRVSRIGFGGATAGLKNYIHAYDPTNPDDRKLVIEAIQKAYELGINYFDTAPGYGDGLSEEIFGEALKNFDQSKIFMASKVSSWGDVDIRKSVDESLRRLNRDYIDLIQIHGTTYDDGQVEKILRPGGILEKLEQLKAEGLIKHIGFTSEDQNEAVYRLIKTGRFDMLQMCYNLIFQHPYDPSRQCGSLYEAEKSNMGISVMRSATSGIFQRWINAVNPQNTFDYTNALIQFTLSNPLVDVVLIGMRTVQRVIDNVKLCNDKSLRVDICKLHERNV
jgi:uncharacterized protein